MTLGMNVGKDEASKRADAPRWSVQIVLTCTEDKSTATKELSLERAPATVADLQHQIERQFNVPAFYQRLSFGPTQLESPVPLHQYSLRSGDTVHVTYLSEANVGQVSTLVDALRRILSFLEASLEELARLPLSQAMEMRLNVEVAPDSSELDNFGTLYVGSSQRMRVANSLLFLHYGGLPVAQKIHGLLLDKGLCRSNFHLQYLEISVIRLVWVLTATVETESAVKRELNVDNVVRSLFRVTLISNAPIHLPIGMNGPVAIELVTSCLGSLSCILEYDAPHIQLSLAANQKFLEQVIGAIQCTSLPFKISLTSLSLLVLLAFNPESHQYLCHRQVVREILKMVKMFGLFFTNRFTDNEKIYFEYLACMAITLLCVWMPDNVTQKAEVIQLLQTFLNTHTSGVVHNYEVEAGFTWNKFLPYMSLVLSPIGSKQFMLASHAHARTLQVACIEMGVFCLQVMLSVEGAVNKIKEQGFLDYITCLPGLMPAGSNVQLSARDVVALVRQSGVQLQPPSLNTIVRANLAVMHYGLEKPFKASAQELISEVWVV